jgi:cold shock CspA family protein/ribosome-associated translation inhibitor RaiA
VPSVYSAHQAKNRGLNPRWLYDVYAEGPLVTSDRTSSVTYFCALHSSIHQGKEVMVMQLPLQITARDVSLSEAAEGDIRAKAANLDTYYDGIMSCRVVVEGPVRHHRKGPYTVRVDLTVPGAELVVDRQADEDLYVAIRDAFDAARRRLEDYARRQRGDVKLHETSPRARVCRLFPEEDYGFLETPDGREIYFHRNSVLHPGFERLEIGTEVRFAEETGDHGPQASTVAILGTRGL